MKPICDILKLPLYPDVFYRFFMHYITIKKGQKMENAGVVKKRKATLPLRDPRTVDCAVLIPWGVSSTVRVQVRASALVSPQVNHTCT